MSKDHFRGPHFDLIPTDGNIRQTKKKEKIFSKNASLAAPLTGLKNLLLENNEELTKDKNCFKTFFKRGAHSGQLRH